MAIGDTQSGLSSVANNGFLTMQPGAGTAWAIHSLFSAGASWETYYTDGTNDIKANTQVAAGERLNLTYRATNGFFFKIKNTSGSTVLMGYNAVQTQ